MDERITSETAARQADALAAKEALDTQLATMEEERVKRDEAFAAAQAEEKAKRAEADAAFRTEVESSIAEVDERRQRDVKSAQDLRTADLATIEQRNAQVDAALEAAQADTDDKFAKAEASQLEDKVELLEAAAQRDKVVDEKFPAADDKFAAVEAQRLEDAAAAATAQEALKAEVQEKITASDAIDEKFTQLETVRQGDLQDAEEKRRLA